MVSTSCIRLQISLIKIVPENKMYTNYMYITYTKDMIQSQGFCTDITPCPKYMTT